MNQLDQLIYRYELIFIDRPEGKLLTHSSKFITEMQSLVSDKNFVLFNDLTPDFTDKKRRTVNYNYKSIKDYFQESLLFIDNSENFKIHLLDIDIGQALNAKRVKMNSNTGSTYVYANRKYQYKIEGEDIYNEIKLKMDIDFFISDRRDVSGLHISKIDTVNHTNKNKSSFFYYKEKGFLERMSYGILYNISQIEFPIQNQSTVFSKVNSRGSMEFYLNYELHGFNQLAVPIALSIGVSNLRGTLSYPDYKAIYDQVDIDNDQYSRIVNGVEIEERYNLTFLDLIIKSHVPLSFMPLKKLSFSIGLITSFPIVKNVEASGTYSYSGYYPQYETTLRNIDRYGFVDDFQLNKNYTLDVPIPQFLLETGINGSLKMSKPNLILNYSLFYRHGILNSINTNSEQIVTEGTEDYNGLLPLTETFKTRVIGLSIGFKRVESRKKYLKLK